MLINKGFLSLFLLLFSLTAFAEYSIKGRLNVSSDWQNLIFLSTIDKLDDYYSANPEHIIQVGNIESDGTFHMKGDNLPLESQYYRLYLVKEETSEFNACLYVGGNDHNFIHLILDNNTNVEIQSDANHLAPFGNYQLIGDAANKALRELSMLVFPSFYFYQIKFPSELQFSEQKLNRDLFEFADSCQHILVALAAIMNTDMDQYYDLGSDKYLNFKKRLGAELNNHKYTDDYYRKLNYYNGEFDTPGVSNWIHGIISFLILALIFSLIKIYKLQNKLEVSLKSVIVPDQI